jgi:UDP-glucose:(heptosyl)LPS alpha-1,3-glucosyltransferase
MGISKRFAFCLFEYVPFGGMQDNLLRMAKECVARGHQVDIFARYWKGTRHDGLRVSILPGRGFSNHKRCESFAKNLRKHLNTKKYDLVVGFNKMPGLDIYYAADTCFAAKAEERNFFYKMTGRYRSYLRLERAVFQKGAGTHILLLSKKEKQIFMQYYGTEEERFHLLPPGISRDRLAPENPAKIRSALRRELSIGQTQNLVLMVGSGFRTKGVDRAIKAISALPRTLKNNTVLVIVGEGHSRPFRRLAKKSGVLERVFFMGGRQDVPKFLVAADLLLHPAYRENTGTVLLEAMAAGLPVLATDICGYSCYIEKSGSGLVVPSPFKQNTLNQMLVRMLTSDEKGLWQGHGQTYIAQTDVFSRHEKAVDIMEQVAGC